LSLTGDKVNCRSPPGLNLFPLATYSFMHVTISRASRIVPILEGFPRAEHFLLKNLVVL